MVPPDARRGRARMFLAHHVSGQRVAGMTDDMDNRVPIRSLSRGIAVLQTINQGGAMTITEISRACGLPFATASRLVLSLVHDGLVVRDADRPRYRPTALVQTLSNGFRGDEGLLHAARPHLIALTQATGWPTGIAMAVGRTLILRDAAYSPQSPAFEPMPIPPAAHMGDHAPGLAYLAALDPEARATLDPAPARRTRTAPTGPSPTGPSTAQIDEVRANGFAISQHGATSCKAAPLFDASGPVGALCVAFDTHAQRQRDATARIAPHLLRTARSISEAWGARAAH